MDFFFIYALETLEQANLLCLVTSDHLLLERREKYILVGCCGNRTLHATELSSVITIMSLPLERLFGDDVMLFSLMNIDIPPKLEKHYGLA